MASDEQGMASALGRVLAATEVLVRENINLARAQIERDLAAKMKGGAAVAAAAAALAMTWALAMVLLALALSGPLGRPGALLALTALNLAGGLFLLRWGMKKISQGPRRAEELARPAAGQIESGPPAPRPRGQAA